MDFLKSIESSNFSLGIKMLPLWYFIMLDEIKSYVKSEFDAHIDLQFHSLDHVTNVAKWAVKLGKYHHLNERELFLLELAAWMHDLGFKECYQGHERAGSKIIGEHLEAKLTSDEIQEVQDLIKATQMPQKPKNLMQKVLCDADLAHLGSIEYYDWLEKLREEWVESLGKSWSDPDWFAFNIDFLKNHQYHTEAAWQLLEPTKQLNIIELQKRMAL